MITIRATTKVVLVLLLKLITIRTRHCDMNMIR